MRKTIKSKINFRDYKNMEDVCQTCGKFIIVSLCNMKNVENPYVIVATIFVHITYVFLQEDDVYLMTKIDTKIVDRVDQNVKFVQRGMEERNVFVLIMRMVLYNHSE